MPESVDVVVAGGGPVGASLALALRGSGRTVVLVEPRARAEGPLRPVALSHGSRLVLERSGAFARIESTPIESIHVSQAGGFGRTLMRCEDHALPALGYVTDASQVAGTLLEAATPERLPGRVASWEDAGERVAVAIDGEHGPRRIAARLLVLADGGRLAGDDLALRDYGQTAIVAIVRAERAHPGRAWERFTPDGPLALLPFGGRSDDAHYIYALVWAVEASAAARLAALPDDRFCARLGERFGRRLGRFVAAGPRASFPLRLWFRRRAHADPRVVAVGNAAQTLHPVAGQGLNLGLRDAYELVDALRSAADVDAALARVEWARAPDRWGTIATTDFLARSFTWRLPGLELARGVALAALQRAAPLKSMLARQMMFGWR